MAVIEIRTEPSGRTRMLFDFRAAAPGCDDVARIEDAMMQSHGGIARAPAEASPTRANRQAASDRNTSRPVTLPSRRRISAS
jgi:hypothetical protein